MHPMVKKNPKLKALYELDEKIGQELLGATGNKLGKLRKLRRRVREEIKSIDVWEPIRKQMREAEDE